MELENVDCNCLNDYDIALLLSGSPKTSTFIFLLYLYTTVCLFPYDALTISAVGVYSNSYS